jgi:hypothetical protein
MQRCALLFALLAAACGGGGDLPKLDGDVGFDDTPSPQDSPIDTPGSGSGTGPYRHTIDIDGTNDFTAGETFLTTSSPSFSAYVTWDADNVYIGESGPDLSTTTSDASTKWLFAYFDIDPGASTGASTSLKYTDEGAQFPSGFGAEYYLRFKSDGTFKSLEHYDGTTWTTMSASPTSANSGTYTEAAFPRSLLTGETAGIITYMINEQSGRDATFAGLYADDFTDGPGSAVPIAHYLKADFTSNKPPNDPSYRAPAAGGSGMEN